jgi:hypothetical protein
MIVENFNQWIAGAVDTVLENMFFSAPLNPSDAQSDAGTGPDSGIMKWPTSAVCSGPPLDRANS